MNQPIESEDEKLVLLTLNLPGQRLDRALAEALPELSRTQCQRLISEGRVSVGGRSERASYRLEENESIQVRIPQPKPVELIPEAIPLDIVYEDEDLVLVNKPAGMVVHPAPGHESGTLVNAVLAHCPDLSGVGGELRPGIVHRLDKDTSGLIVVAKNDLALRYLQDQFKSRTINKTYQALVEGQFNHAQVTIDAPIGRDPRNRQKMTVIPKGSSSSSRPSRTVIIRLKTFDAFTLVECHPLTGRTHQIRVHLAYSGYPIAGDTIYGRRKQSLPMQRHFLHAAQLTFKRPSDDREMTFQAPLAGDLQDILDTLGPSLKAPAE